MTDVTARGDILRATLLVAVSACCFGSISPLTLIAIDHGAALPGIQAWRYTTTAVLFSLFAWWRPAVVPPPDPGAPVVTPWYSWRVMFVAGGGQALVATLALMALRWIPAATEAFLFYTFPAWVAIIMAVRGVERIDGNRALALGLALSGIGVMVGAPDADSLHPMGVTLALAAGLVYALYIPVLGGLQRGRPPLDVSRAITIGGSTIFIVWAASTGSLFANFDAMAMAASVAQGVLSAGAFLGFLAGLRTLGAVRTAITSTIEPFWTSVLGVAVLAQPIGLGTILGGMLIMGAVLLLQRPPVAKARLHSS